MAAPVVWVGLELIRGHLITGFSAGLLGHTQVQWPALLQISDLVGAYGVSFVVMLVAACLRGCCRSPAAVDFLAGRRGCGSAGRHARLRPLSTGRNAAVPAEPVRVALIQGSLDTCLTSDRVDETFAHYGRLTSEAREANSRLDLVIWPESMFAVPSSPFPSRCQLRPAKTCHPSG